MAKAELERHPLVESARGPAERNTEGREISGLERLVYGFEKPMALAVTLRDFQHRFHPQ
ncbi:hypothetical protein [Mesorhizobium sp.]|uniref:hypothetical protein n=1 Tax=Mesorhizobium sp. TaxID=1871066 RepID=UPI0025BA4AD3|nr:hypothetical protein [Mesorhizobium sp.]